MVTDWTQDRIDLMIKLLRSELTASAVGDALGVSRSAITGKVMRLGLTVSELNGHKHGSNRSEHKAANGRTYTHRNGWTSPFRPKKVKVVPPPKPVVSFVPPPVEGIPIDTLNDRTCRWPMWHQEADPRLYCGQRTALGSSYCGQHTFESNKPPLPYRKSAY